MLDPKDELPEFDWANVARPEKPKEEEPQVCTLDDPNCEACGS